MNKPTPNAGARDRPALLRRAAPLAVAAMLSTGCSDMAVSPPTGPPPPVAMKLQNAGELRAMVDNVVERVLPALPDAYKGDLGSQLQQLSTALEGGAITNVSDALSKAQVALDRSSGQIAGDAAAAATLGEVRLALSLLSDAVAPTSAR